MMHEMAITQALINISLEHAGSREISDIYLRVGQMSAIVPESVDVFFEHLSKDTLAEGAKLHFEIQPIQMTCQDCGKRANIDEWRGQKPHLIMLGAITAGCECGSKKLRVSDGVEFNVISITTKDE